MMIRCIHRNKHIYKKHAILFSINKTTKRFHQHDEHDDDDDHHHVSEHNGKSIFPSEMPTKDKLAPAPNYTAGLKEATIEMYFNPENYIGSNNIDNQDTKTEEQVNEKMNEYRNRIEQYRGQENRVEAINAIVNEMVENNTPPDLNTLTLINDIFGEGRGDASKPKAKRSSEADLSQLFANPPEKKPTEFKTKKMNNEEMQEIYQRRMKKFSN
jgi:hypothetical protein